MECRDRSIRNTSTDMYRSNSGLQKHDMFVEQLKAQTFTALSNLMPNVDTPGASVRRIFAKVVHTQLLYGDPSLTPDN